MAMGWPDIVAFGIGGSDRRSRDRPAAFRGWEASPLGRVRHVKQRRGWSSDDLYPRELADVNGDGLADIVGFGIAGVTVALATGAGI